MEPWLAGVIGGVVAVIILALPRRKCPGCGEQFPRIRMPASRRQALWGGWTCSKCGYEVDRHGRRIEGVTPGKPVLKVAVMADGRLTVDGSQATLESLRESLKQLGMRNGEVWYYREAACGEPPPQAMQVVQAVIENRLPIKLSTRSDYSDAVGMDGRAILQ